jgi:Ferritin-like domain
MVSFTQISLLGLSCLPALVSAAPTTFSLPNGFPNPDPAAITQIEIAAHGSLPNGGPPKSINPNTITSLQLIAFNELVEVAFFTELIANITNNVKGYQFKNGDARNFALKTLKAVQAQEELHELNANDAVKKFSGTAIEPCQYKFPVDTFDDAIALAATFTDVVLGTLGNVATLLGANGDSDLIAGVAAVIGQEGEQNGWYRTLQDKIPSALPFLTASTREFAFSALNQDFVVPNSCPSSNFKLIDLPVFGALNVITDSNTAAKTKQIQFEIDTSKTPVPTDCDRLFVVYINQQNVPIVGNVEKSTVSNKKITFDASFPFEELSDGTFGNGLTIAALTSTNGPFTSAEDVAAVTLFGPGLIEID